mgnify:CR=1 FL=1
MTDTPEWIYAYGPEWSYYVRGHDPENIHVIDDPADMEWVKLWMRPVKASEAADFAIPDFDCDDTVIRNPKTGRFEPQWVWVECREESRDAEPFMAVRSKRIMQRNARSRCSRDRRH